MVSGYNGKTFVSLIKLKNMSVIIAKIDNEKSLSTLKQILNIFSKKVKIISNESYLDSKLAELSDEGMKSRTLSKDEARKELKKRGIRI